MVDVAAPSGALPDSERIKSNMQRMIAEGASEADLNGYMQMEGVTHDTLAEPKYFNAAKQDVAWNKQHGFGTEPYARRIMQGATFNAADEILAGLQTPVEMYRRGTWNPAEGWRYAKAYQDEVMRDARRQTPGWGGTIAEIAGGAGSGVGLARAGATAFAGLPVNAGWRATTGAAMKDAAAYGAISGGMEGNSMPERLGNAGIGAAVGVASGAALQPAMSAAGSVLGPIVSNIRARQDPASYAQRQVGRGILESTATVPQIADDVTRAAAEGQPMYTLADAMGSPGQRLLYTTARAPGPARSEVRDFLNERQAGQAQRVSSQLAHGFDAPQTAAQRESELITRRTLDADAGYGAARAQSGAVDVSPAIAAADQVLMPGVTRVMRPQTDIADNSIEAAVRRARSYLTDGRSQISDFNGALAAKWELDHMIENATPTLQRNLIPIRDALDNQLASASAPYAAARDRYRETSRAIDMIGEGTNAARRGRMEDTIQRFNSPEMTPEMRQSWRYGYVEPAIEKAQSRTVGENAAREFTTPAFRAESTVMAAPERGPQMRRQLTRENRMFETRHEALGNSNTAENLMDMGGAARDPGALWQLASGNWGNAARSLLSRASDIRGGYTPEVRQEMARLLLARGEQGVSAQEMQQLLTDAAQRAQMARTLGAALARGGFGGLSVSPSAQR